jgi:hypothetical protein
MVYLLLVGASFFLSACSILSASSYPLPRFLVFLPIFASPFFFFAFSRVALFLGLHLSFLLVARIALSRLSEKTSSFVFSFFLALVLVLPGR